MGIPGPEPLSGVISGMRRGKSGAVGRPGPERSAELMSETSIDGVGLAGLLELGAIIGETSCKEERSSCRLLSEGLPLREGSDWEGLLEGE